MEIIIFFLVLGAIFLTGQPMLGAFIGFGMFAPGESQPKRTKRMLTPSSTASSTDPRRWCILPGTRRSATTF